MFRHFLLSVLFVVYSYHEILLASIKNNYIYVRLVWWLSFLVQYEIEIRHLLGRNNDFADYVSLNTDAAMDLGPKY